MENMTTSEYLMKPREAAQMLNISRSLVYQLIRSGDIPAIKIKSTVRIKVSDLHFFIEKNQQTKNYQLPLFK
jgi:excisionase family DNA binding protein